MIGFIIFILVWLFVIVPLYKSFRKSQASKKLNDELLELTDKYRLHISCGSAWTANVISNLAEGKVRECDKDIRLSS